MRLDSFSVAAGLPRGRSIKQGGRRLRLVQSSGIKPLLHGGAA